tara:strand:+ start:585 stop:884 length:300 start_codon:yes stop_codon:yes gene_type:complete
MKFNDAFREYILAKLKEHKLPYITFTVEQGLPEDDKMFEMLSKIAQHFETTINGDVLLQAQMNSVGQKKPSSKKPEEIEEPTKIPDVFLKAFTEDENLT